jgi:hypothetical protein
VQDVFAAVTVVDVEIHQCHPFQPVHVERVAYADGNIVKSDPPAALYSAWWPGGRTLQKPCGALGQHHVGGHHGSTGSAQAA